MDSGRNGDWLVPVVRGIAFTDEREAEAFLLADTQTTVLPWAVGRTRSSSKSSNFVNALCPTALERRTCADLLVRSLVHQGLKGNLGALKQIFNRLVGRVPFLIERIGVLPNQAHQTISHDWTPVQPGSGRTLSVEQKTRFWQSLISNRLANTFKSGQAEIRDGNRR